MTRTKAFSFRPTVSLSRLSKGPVTMNLPEDIPGADRITLRRTGIIGGYIGYSMPTEFIECTIRLKKNEWCNITARADDSHWAKAVEEAVRLYELSYDQEPKECDLEALRAEWQAYKDAAEPYTDAIIDRASCTSDGVEYVRYCLAYIDRPLEMSSDLEEALGIFSEFRCAEDRKHLCEFIELIYQSLKDAEMKA